MDFKIHYKSQATDKIIGQRMISVYAKYGQVCFSVRAAKELNIDETSHVVLASSGESWYIAVVDDKNGYKVNRTKSNGLTFKAKRVTDNMFKTDSIRKFTRFLIAKEPIQKEDLFFYELIRIDY